MAYAVAVDGISKQGPKVEAPKHTHCMSCNMQGNDGKISNPDIRRAIHLGNAQIAAQKMSS